MGELINLVTPLHLSTKRNYIERMMNDKVHCMKVAKEFEEQYWDGDRKYGFGGYKYDGRWKPVAESLIKRYGLTEKSKILDVGCGKAHLLFELKRLLPGAELVGFDVSKHGITTAPEEIRDHLFQHRAEDTYPYADNYFDLVISLNTLHNLRVNQLKSALQEIERVGKKGYVLVEGYRNEQELFNLECWALTCESFFRPEEWVWLYNEFGYSGDYEFIYME